ncbi:MAG: hypothetical protein HY290_26375 [Planctomycetia bacterium]|nr:hypothetical protein [Planctomycetia bacterium]
MLSTPFMPFGAWVHQLPMDSNSTGGISVNLRLEIYDDGHGRVVCADKPDLIQTVHDHTEMEGALRRLWDRATREASRRKYFKA